MTQANAKRRGQGTFFPVEFGFIDPLVAAPVLGQYITFANTEHPVVVVFSTVAEVAFEFIPVADLSIATAASKYHVPPGVPMAFYVGVGPGVAKLSAISLGGNTRFWAMRGESINDFVDTALAR